MEKALPAFPRTPSLASSSPCCYRQKGQQESRTASRMQNWWLLLVVQFLLLQVSFQFAFQIIFKFSF